MVHVRSMKHLQMEQVHQLKKRAEGNLGHTEIGDIFQVSEAPEEENEEGKQSFLCHYLFPLLCCCCVPFNPCFFFTTFYVSMSHARLIFIFVSFSPPCSLSSPLFQQV
jgi:hypothetical protein